MESSLLFTLASAVLPQEVLKYFDIVNIEETSSELHIHLDEKYHKELNASPHFESKGFMPPTHVTDFPIRDHKVILVLRRRRWLDKRTGQTFSFPLNLEITAKGTRYSKEFAAFLKGTYGEIPVDLPYT